MTTALYSKIALLNMLNYLEGLAECWPKLGCLGRNHLGSSSPRSPRQNDVMVLTFTEVDDKGVVYCKVLITVCFQPHASLGSHLPSSPFHTPSIA